MYDTIYLVDLIFLLKQLVIHIESEYPIFHRKSKQNLVSQYILRDCPESGGKKKGEKDIENEKDRDRDK